MGGHAVAMTWPMSAVYDMKPGGILVPMMSGWVVGQFYIVYTTPVIWMLDCTV